MARMERGFRSAIQGDEPFSDFGTIRESEPETFCSIKEFVVGRTKSFLQTV
jgi:hypothetical protein